MVAAPNGFGCTFRLIKIANVNNNTHYIYNIEFNILTMPNKAIQPLPQHILYLCHVYDCSNTLVLTINNAIYLYIFITGLEYE